MTRRVVITGFGAVTALGNTYAEVSDNMRAGKTAIRHMPDWEDYAIHTKLGAPLPPGGMKVDYPRKKIRTMGPVALMAVKAAEDALRDSGLEGDPIITNGRTGIAYGSSWGSVDPVLGFAELMTEKATKKLNSSSYVKMMSHTAAVNLGLFFGAKGRIIPTSSACTSGSQGIGFGYETIASGQQDVMIVGGAEELSITEAAVFDTLYATSCQNDAPETTPRPFDKNRDGLVIGEGATTLILEEYDRAKTRGAKIYAEIIGFGTNSDGAHITQPNTETMEVAMRLALESAALQPADIGFISAHGTATDFGDIAESLATQRVFGTHTPIHSLKSFFGHTLGACGSMEVWLLIEMMREGWFAPTINLQEVDPECGDLDYVMNEGRNIETDLVMSNNFAFGGINTSLIFRRMD